jgi:transcriptional regulator with XRE-family HTH domain
MDEQVYTWGRRIRAYRKLKRLTQKELAAALHVSVSVLGAIERGDRPPSEQFLAEVAEALDIELDELKGNTVK